MASISEEVGLFVEVSNKRPLENGCVPKYKPRKVSAVRDFPPGCGLRAVPADFKHEENSSGGAGVLESGGVNNCEVAQAAIDNGVESFLASNTMEADRVDIPKFLNFDGIKSSEIVNDEGPSGVKISNVEVDCLSHCIISLINEEVAEPVDALVEDYTVMTIDGCANVKEVMMEIGSTCGQLPNEVEGQAVEALDQPVELDKGERLDALVGKRNTVNALLNGVAMITESDSSKAEPEPEPEVQLNLKELNEVELSVLIPSSVAEEATYVLDGSVSVDELPLVGFSQPSTSFHGSFKLGACAVVKDKCNTRRVSAVRDFPPGCGTNIGVRAEEKQHTVTAGNDCLDGVKKLEIKLEEMNKTNTIEACSYDAQNVPQGMTPTGTVKAIEFQELNRARECDVGPQDSNIEETKARQSAVKLGTLTKAELDSRHRTSVMKETVVPSLKRSATVKHRHSDFGSDHELHRLVVHGLSAAPFCPWRKGKLPSNLRGESAARKSKKHSSPVKHKFEARNRHLEADCLGSSSTRKTAVPFSYDEDGNHGSSVDIDKEDHGVYDEKIPYLTPVPIQAIPCNEDIEVPVGKEIVVYSPDTCDDMKHLHHGFSLADEVEREVVHGLMAAPYCPQMQGRIVSETSDRRISVGKVKNQKSALRKKVKAVAKKSSSKLKFPGEQSIKQKEVSDVDEDGSPKGLMLADEGVPVHHRALPENSFAIHEMPDIGVSLPPFGPNYSSQGDSRNRVRETLRLFHAICRKLLQKEEANLTPDEEGNLRESDKKMKRIDLLSAKIIKYKGKEVNTDKQMFGQVPGVEVGDEFQYRVELAIVGIHRLYQAGIDWMKVDGRPVAISIVASGAYSDDLENADVLIYSGQGGNVVGKNKQPEDQKLERGNLALKNSITTETPVRVVRGWKESKTIDPADSRPKTVTIYVYDGLYTVKRYWNQVGPRGKQVFMFELRRNPGQPELAWKELKNSNKFNTRPGVCVGDISGGKEPFPICAINTIDDEKPPAFNYTLKMVYPDWFCPILPEGCNCIGRCSDSKKCPCAVKNGGEIPFNRNGAIVEAKPLVFECGPSCKCPPSCYNRVTQRGIKVKLEIFKTDLRGWGLRSLNSIPSGSFICEYAGELLEDKEAEQRVGNDEYLFDIGQNYSDFSLNAEEKATPVEPTEEAEAGFTIDAGQYGNIGRFVNHSCSPNLYAQNVIYDHDDKRMPHVMLFSAENIPPLQELTYHYNYALDQVRDSNGTIKIKKCHCGSAECTGRMY